MSNKSLTPKSIAKPGGQYSHGIEVGPDARWVYVSGQVGWSPDGKIEEGMEAQTRRAFQNVLAVLAESGMGAKDIVRLNSYITDAADVAKFRAGRDAVMGDALPASTLVVITALVHPDLKVEVEAVAAKA
ncbi:MAG: RidA family protein [Minwuia sp.]|nr:RidA family protein [Minwuia sp.]